VSHRERTIVQLDPMAGVNGWPITILGSIGVVVYAIVMTILNGQDIDVPALTIVALGAVVAAFTLLAVAASPLRPPVSRQVHVAGLVLLLGAMALNAASMAQGNLYIQDDWGTIVIGLYSLFLCPYRPPRELVKYGVIAAVFAGFIVLLQVPSLVSPVPAFAFVVIAVTPMVALTLAGAAFASVVLKMTTRWGNRAANAVQALAAERLPGITRSVQQDRVTILNRDVVPFFAEVLARDEIGEADRQRATAIARAIRSVMVHEVDRTWLETLVAETLRGAPDVDDPERMATAMTPDQRIAIRALLVGLADQRSFDPAGLAITIERGAVRAVGEVDAAFSPADATARTLLAPYLAVIRVVFASSDVELSATSLTVRFEYDQH
jgi:hypothetical protein